MRRPFEDDVSSRAAPLESSRTAVQAPRQVPGTRFEEGGEAEARGLVRGDVCGGLRFPADVFLGADFGARLAARAAERYAG